MTPLDMTLLDELFETTELEEINDIPAREKYDAIIRHFGDYYVQLYKSAQDNPTRITSVAYYITIASLCEDQLINYIHPEFGDIFERKLLDHFYEMSLTDSVPDWFVRQYGNTDLGIADATDSLVDRLCEDILEDIEYIDGGFSDEN